MSQERSRRDPIIAQRIARFRKIQEGTDEKTDSLSQIEFPNQPIETVAISVLKELEGVRQEIKGREDDNFADSPLTAAYRNFLFIQSHILTINLEELLTRTKGRVFFDRNKALYFGLLPLIPDWEEEDRDENKYLCFDDGQNTHPLKDPLSFQEVWDRADRKGKSSIVKFGRLPKKEIIKKFENFAKTNLTVF